MVLPIRQKDIYGGLAEISGLIRVENLKVIVEYQVQDELFGMMNSNPKRAILPYSMIDSVEVDKKWFTHYFNIYLNQFPDVEKPLSLKGNLLSFAIKKADREKALQLKSRLMLSISEYKLNKLDEDFSDEDFEINHSESNKKSLNEIEYREDDKQEPGRLKNILRNDEKDDK